MEDNLKLGFALGLHLHRQHAETFYILEGDVDFYLDGDWLTAPPGSTVHIPPGLAHAVVLPEGKIGRLLMIFQASRLRPVPARARPRYRKPSSTTRRA